MTQDQLRALDDASTSRVRRSLNIVACTAALGGLLFGYDVGIMSGALLFVTKAFAMTSATKGVLSSVVLLGAMAGSVVTSPITTRFGRRRLLVVAGAVFVVGAVGAGAAPTIGLVILFRAVLGIAVGMAATGVPTYIAEVAPREVRGRLTTLNAVMITVGILVSYLVGLSLSSSAGWRLMFALGAIPGLVLILGMLFLPESPRWLASVGRREEARAVLRRIRTGDIESELADIAAASVHGQRNQLRQLISTRWRRRLAVVVGLAVGEQLTGATALLVFAPTFLHSAGVRVSTSLLISVGLGTVALVITLTASRLVDLAGRRFFLLIGTATQSASLLGIAVNTIAAGPPAVNVVLIIVYQAAFNIGLAPIVWLMMPELFPLSLRSVGTSVGTLMIWITQFVVTLTFLPLIDLIGRTSIFVFYGALSMLVFLFVVTSVPETRGRTLEELETALSRTSHGHAERQRVE